MTITDADLAELDIELDAEDTEAADMDAVSYASIPTILRRWLHAGYLPFGNPVIFAGDGEVGKGVLFALYAAHVVLGVPFPGEAEARDPGRVIWIAGLEDDQFEDLAPRFRAAIAYLVELHQLAPELADPAHGAIRWIHDLSEWRDGSAFAVPTDTDRLLDVVRELNDRDAHNRRRDPDDPHAEPAGPPVRLVVMDPLSELVAEGYTIDSRTGARRVMRPIKRFARLADVALVIIHHMTKDGKVAGSKAVLDSLRLVFVIERRKDNHDVRVITRRKSNISAASPQQYTTRQAYPDTHAEWVDAADARSERIAQAAAQAADPGSIRARVRAAAGQLPEPGQAAQVPAAGPDAAPGGAVRLMRRELPPGGTLGAPQLLGRSHPNADAARVAAMRDAGQVLTWKLDPSGREVCAVKRADGTVVGYSIVPGAARP
jgi:hypothetical protein